MSLWISKAMHCLPLTLFEISLQVLLQCSFGKIFVFLFENLALKDGKAQECISVSLHLEVQRSVNSVCLKYLEPCSELCAYLVHFTEGTVFDIIPVAWPLFSGLLLIKTKHFLPPQAGQSYLKNKLSKVQRLSLLIFQLSITCFATNKNKLHLLRHLDICTKSHFKNLVQKCLKTFSRVYFWRLLSGREVNEEKDHSRISEDCSQNTWTEEQTILL